MRLDPCHATLATYRRLAAQGAVDLFVVPIFLGSRGGQWSAASFRAHYWRPACAHAGLDVDIHQARHWYVTQAIGQVHEEARLGLKTVEQGLKDLVEYM